MENQHGCVLCRVDNIKIIYPGGTWDGMGDDPRVMLHHHIDKHYTILYHEYGIRRPIPQEFLDDTLDTILSESEFYKNNSP